MAREVKLSDIVNTVHETRVLTQLNVVRGQFHATMSQEHMMHEYEEADSSALGGNVYKITSAEQSHAKKLLENLALLANPICKKHGWKVGILQEFYPSNPGLLGMNVNGGQSILIRLKSPGNHKSFLPWFDIIGTLVHELTHNDIGPHNEAFYALMNKIYEEVEKLPNYNAVCNEIRKGDGIGYRTNTIKVAQQESVFQNAESQGRKLGNFSGAFPFPQTTLIAPNGEVLRQGTINNKIAGVDTSKLSLKEKVAMAAIARSGSAPVSGQKLGTGTGTGNDASSSSVSSYKHLDKEEMRILVLANLEERRRRERGVGGTTGMAGSNDSCLCNNQQTRFIRPASLPQSDICLPISTNPSAQKTSSTSLLSSSASLSSASSLPKSASGLMNRPTTDVQAPARKPLYFPYSDKLPPQNNNSSSLETSSHLDSNSWLCQICLDFNSPYAKACIFCGFESGSVASFNEDNKMIDKFASSVPNTQMDYSTSTNNSSNNSSNSSSSSVSNTTNIMTNETPSTLAGGGVKKGGALSSSTMAQEEQWECLVCFENNRSRTDADVHLCAFCGALRGYTLENEQEKIFLQSL